MFHDLWPPLDEDIAPVRGPLPQSQLDYRPLVEKLTIHINTFLMMLHEARVKQKQLLSGDPQLLVYKNIPFSWSESSCCSTAAMPRCPETPLYSLSGPTAYDATSCKNTWYERNILLFTFPNPLPGPTITSSPKGTLTFKPDLRLVPNGDSPGRALQGNGYTYERREQGLQGDREVGEITLRE
ncbi:hypothetical protein NP493_1141g00038 [Ridgeia piscesae]|uniref:Uncharacterized protein n=1 Tax=Ridgeia piscesae TaxID=27915 RepID=A0AAD9NJP8_RIDPI|nr:hypothetical protein NP493_1141g00038 [Ridgeia piscesae]